MFNSTVTQIDETITHLRGLADLLADEFDEQYHPEPSPETKACREAFVRIQALIPKLQIARSTQLPTELRRQRPQCLECD